MQPVLRMRVSNKHIHYADDLVDGALVLGLFGDALTEVSIELCSDEGLLRRYDEVQFHSRVLSGDYLEIYIEKTYESRLKFRCLLTAKRIVRGNLHNGECPVALDSPDLVATAKAEMVMPYHKRRAA